MYKSKKDKLYRCYFNIKSRCCNKNNPNYIYYGKRGIKLLWKTFDDFYKDMGPTYIEGLTIDRIDNDGSYCKENCRRADTFTQARNKRHKYGYIRYTKQNRIKINSTTRIFRLLRKKKVKKFRKELFRSYIQDKIIDTFQNESVMKRFLFYTRYYERNGLDTKRITKELILWGNDKKVIII